MAQKVMHPMVFLLMNTDVESPSVQYVVQGPADFDFESAQEQYRKRKIKSPFVDWLVQNHGFNHVPNDTVQIYNFVQPVYQRPPRKGTEARAAYDMMQTAIQEQFKAISAGLEEKSKVLRMINEGGKIQFNAAMEANT